MDEHLRGQLEGLEKMAGLSALFSSFSHELNNHLAAAILAAENVRHEQSDASFALLDKQLKQVSELSSVLQRLGAENLSGRSKSFRLNQVIADFAKWIELGRAQGEAVAVVMDEDVAVRGREVGLLLALTLLVRSFPESAERSLHVWVGSEDVPRSKWTDDGDVVTMAKVVLDCRGVPGNDWPAFELSDLVNNFFKRSATPRELCVMAAWEIIRKVSGRPSSRLSFELCPREQSPRVVLWLPPAVDWA